MNGMNNGNTDTSRFARMNESQRAYWGVTSNQGALGNCPPDPNRQAAPMQQAPTAQQPPVAQQVPSTGPCNIASPGYSEPRERKANALSGMSVAFIVLGLLLLGGAIAPLLAYFQVAAAAKYFIGVAFIAMVTLVAVWLAGKMFRRSPKRDVYVVRMRVSVLIVAELVMASFTMACGQFAFCWEVTSLLLAVTLLAVLLVSGRRPNSNAYVPLRINEIVVLFVLSCVIAFAAFPNYSGGMASRAVVSTACYAGTVLVVSVVAALRARELFAMRRPSEQLDAQGAGANVHPKSSNAAFLVLTALMVTAVFSAFVYTFVPFGRGHYAFDIVFLASAVICTVIGFRADNAAMRLTGLVFAFAAIAKMALLDTLGCGSLEQAIAYIAGGVLCFGLGALYNFAVKRLIP